MTEPTHISDLMAMILEDLGLEVVENEREDDDD